MTLGDAPARLHINGEEEMHTHISSSPFIFLVSIFHLDVAETERKRVGVLLALLP
jgi:hypothetical protein